MAQRVFSDRYKIVRHLARGGMAEVYLAHDLLLDRPVALKVLFPEFAADRSFVERFRREARAAANLNHPNIVSIYDWGEEGGTYFIVMEYVDGRTLRDVIRADGPLHPTRSAEIGADIAAALGFAHRNGVIHRDVKPGNVMIAGLVKVTDFGIARAGDPSESLTQTGAVMGTATYFSPEQAQGQPIDPRSDVYSLGVVLYEMVTSRPPFSGDNPVAIAYQHVREQPAPPSRLNPDVPPPFEAIVLAAMAKNREHRYPSAEALRADLLRFAQGRPVAAMARHGGAGPGVGGAAVAGAAGGGGAGGVAGPAGAAAAAAGAGGAAAALAGAGATQAGATQAGAAPTGIMAPVGGGRGTRSGESERTRMMSRQTDVLVEDDRDYDDRPPARTSTYIVILLLLLAVLGGMLFLLARTLGVGGSKSVVVPTVVGEQQGAAESKLKDVGLKASIKSQADSSNQPGQVLAQSPTAGATVKKGSTVTLTVAGQAEQIQVPGVVGKNVNDATDQLETLGFTTTITRKPDDKIKEDIVLDQQPKANDKATKGSAIALTVSSGPPQVTVPSLFNVPEADAAAQLRDAGFEVERTSSSDPSLPAGRVLRTDPGAGTPVPKGSTVTLIVSSGPPPTTAAPTTVPVTTTIPFTVPTLFPPLTTSSTSTTKP